MTHRKEVPRLANTARKGPGKPSYADVMTERNELRRTLAVAERRLAQYEDAIPELERSRQEVVETLKAEREQFQVDRRAFDEALQHTATLLVKAQGKLSGGPGLLEYGCVHPHSAFPSDYSGVVITDGVRWYCNRNHMRVAVQTRAGLV